MGPSGSGKSTLLHCMAGVFTPDIGAVTYRPDASDARSVGINELGETERSRLRLEDFGFVEGLSGGQAQRVAVSRALVTEPAILFADEPTGSLDSLTSETVLTLMLELVQSSGTTLVMITHDPRVAAYADRDVVVRDGRIGDR